MRLPVNHIEQIQHSSILIQPEVVDVVHSVEGLPCLRIQFVMAGVDLLQKAVDESPFTILHGIRIRCLNVEDWGSREGSFGDFPAKPLIREMWSSVVWNRVCYFYLNRSVDASILSIFHDHGSGVGCGPPTTTEGFGNCQATRFGVHGKETQLGLIAEGVGQDRTLVYVHTGDVSNWSP